MGPTSFISTLDELKPFLKFNALSENINENYNIILFHIDALKDEKQKELIENNNNIKICAGEKSGTLKNYDEYLNLPTTLKEINLVVENSAVKKKFNKNSSIEIKNYFLNKNEKKLSKSENFIILTEKEIKL